MPDTDLGYKIMKKMIIGCAVVLAMVASASVSASSQVNESMNSSHMESVHVHAQGAHCNGTVGCSCPGFEKISHKEVWKEAYCKHCGHHRRSHK